MTFLPLPFSHMFFGRNDPIGVNWSNYDRTQYGYDDRTRQEALKEDLNESTPQSPLYF